MIFNCEPQVSEKDIESVVSCMRKGIASPEHIADVEKKMASMFGTPCVVVSSGTSALHLSLMSMGVGPGDEVICPDLTFAATWNAIEHVGATPVFADVDSETWCINADQVNQMITNKTKAVISVDLFGNPCDYNSLKKICDERDLHLILDSAESLGSKYNNSTVLKIGDAACVSFNLNKIVTSSGGGAVFSENIDVLNQVKKIANQSKVGSAYDYDGLGYNYRMPAICAALLSSQLDDLSKYITRKRQIHDLYRSKLEDLNVKYPVITQGGETNYWVPAVLFSSQRARDNVSAALLENKIESKLLFTPATLVKWIKSKYNYSENKVSKDIFQRSLILPSSLSLSEVEVDVICKTIKSALT